MAEETQEQQSPDKVKRNFEKTIKQLSEILGSEKALTPSNKIPKDELGEIVEALFKEEKERNAKEISEQLRTLLKGYTDLKSSVKQKQKELEKLEQDKMKEFNKAAQSLFDRVESIKVKQEEFSAGLKEATEGEQPK
jgi:methyl-accepting chemotaxis protein